jgi:phosphohistidine phosphatase
VSITEVYLVELLLVRHAIAFSRDSNQWPNDGDRPLTPQGEARFRKAARGLKTVWPSIELVLSSPYARAWRTAEILAEEVGWPTPEPCPELEAERSRSDAARVLRSMAGHASVALVGHEPNLSELASYLLTGNESRLFVEMKKGGVACLALEGGPGAGKGILRWLASPKILRTMAP